MSMELPTRHKRADKAQMREDVYCTLLMSDSYLPGAAVLAHSLRDVGSAKKLAVLATLDTLSTDTITVLKELYDYVLPVEPIRSRNLANLYLMGRPDLCFTFTKIALWRQTQFRKIVYLDADVVVLRNMDELFGIEDSFAAAPDMGWPDAFNSGVMVLSPDMGEYWALQTMAATGESFDGADQGLLNQYFEHRPWLRLKFTFNCTPNAEYQWEPAYRYFKRDISAVHFIGKEKPWSSQRSGAGRSSIYNELLARWWAVYDRHLRQSSAVAPSVFQSEQPNESQTKTFEASYLPSQPAVDASAVDAPASSTPVSNSAPLFAPVDEPRGPVTALEPSSNGQNEAPDAVAHGYSEPVQTAPREHVFIPQASWDATRFEPPAQSRPEALNFPNQTYHFSENRSLFKAPEAYPEPPKDMWYAVPPSRPQPAEKPKPIFPWEQDPDRPKAARVFAEDLSTESTPAPALPSPMHAFSTIHYQDKSTEVLAETDRDGAGSPGVSLPVTAPRSWQAFQQDNVNAWDNVPGIETYVRTVMESHNRGAKSQTVQQPGRTDTSVSSLGRRRNHQQSLIITDFPSATERPSLPVTPVRRPTFWGKEQDGSGELLDARGVPDQVDWVCPHCGFPSVITSDFQQSVEGETPTGLDGEESGDSISSLALLHKPASSRATPDFSSPWTPPKTHARSGLSPGGVPLASLTSPEFLVSHSPSSSLDATPASSAFSVLEQQNPNTQLEQLRRSSLVELEHLIKDEHPSLPLRALPKHSVSAEDDARSPSAPQNACDQKERDGDFDSTKSSSLSASKSTAAETSHPRDWLDADRVLHDGASTDNERKGQHVTLPIVDKDEPPQQPLAHISDSSEMSEAEGTTATHSVSAESESPSSTSGHSDLQKSTPLFAAKASPVQPTTYAQSTEASSSSPSLDTFSSSSFLTTASSASATFLLSASGSSE